MRSLLAISVSLLISMHSWANPKFDGNVRYSFSNNNSQVSLSYTKIKNSSPDFRTGTIKMSLWACLQPYSGGSIHGTRVAEIRLDGLDVGRYWHSGRQTINATLPNYPDHYFMVMTLEEYFTGGYGITDWVNFDSTVYLNRPSPPKKATLNIEGPYKWQTYPSEKKIEIKVGKISHNRNGTTGTLRVVAWATKQPYKGGNINGYILGYIQRDQLANGMMYPSTHRTVGYTAPPPGHYYVTIALQEYNGSGYTIMDYYTFDGTHTFR